MRMLDLFAGELGWTIPFVERGWSVTAVDLRRPRRDLPAAVMFFESNVLAWSARDVAKFDFVCASSPCPQFSVHGMRHFHPNPPYPSLGVRLFNHVREICEESGVPYVLENVRAAQLFVGKARNNAGSFYLWGSGVPTNSRMPNCRKGFRHKEMFAHARTSRPWASATIPAELAILVAEHAERLIETKVGA